MALLPGPAERRGGGGGARARHVIINVGGCRVRLAWAALARCPLARLERLRACRGHDELLRVCDDYDVSRDEFFFDRSPCAFRAIVALLRAGKLRLLRGPCALAFRDELAYWGIDEARLERCCLRRLRRREEEAAEARAGPAERGAPGSPACAPGPGGRLASGRRRLRDVVDDPRSGPAGKLFACVSVAFVAVTAVGLCLSTMPDIRAEEERVSAGRGSWQGTRAGLGRAGGGGDGTGPGGGGQRGPRAGLESRPGGSQARGGRGTHGLVALGTPAPLVETMGPGTTAPAPVRGREPLARRGHQAVHCWQRLHIPASSENSVSPQVSGLLTHPVCQPGPEAWTIRS